jgi:hypothetical protein
LVEGIDEHVQGTPGAGTLKLLSEETYEFRAIAGAFNDASTIGLRDLLAH